MTKELRPGDRAPSFKLPTDSGSEISTAQLKGKPFIVYFYPRDDTSGCTKEAISFSEEKRKFDSLGVEIIGISKDTAASHEKFKKKHKLGITLASDSEIKVAQAYGVWVEKSLYGRRYMGMDRATFLMDAKGVIKQIWRKVKVPGHVAAVLEAARVL
ncbi:MAG TPA: thioredoxin-dependent thiol peroxidase [Rhizomicrobium sp.]|jgi:peroxiredoxin Q/BCP|nr:thioredoxin-dependent thiol peroxidase [Rhizomicrobium sp.]